MVAIKRVYESARKEDGTRILVDRFWPRGVTKERAHIQQWMKEVAPSKALFEWYGHVPAKWEEFRKRYREELKEKKTELAELRRIAKKGRLTLVFGARDTNRNQAAVLAEVINND